MRKNNKKIVNYDREADVLAFYLGSGKEEEFVELAPGIAAEFDPRGNLIGVEILNASKVLKPFLKSLQAKVPA